ncbi:MAG: hydantoinase B/oxoprolinase family protein [Clostridia bacterium]|nr:MAG: hydantoinase B/oxoprolinase family protein [Clostridia bacterium]
MAAPSWQELLAWIYPVPPSPEEVELARAIKPGEYEIYTEKLNNICLEAKEVFVRCGVASTILAGDNIVGLYSADGDLVTAWCGTYLHAITSQLPIKYILKYYRDDPSVGINEGDVFYVNDALYGGIHNGDQIAIMPIFHEGELIAWSCAAVHEPESGGTDPGSFPVNAKSRYDEGLKLPPIKIGHDYQLHGDALEMIANMLGRAPRMSILDLRARVSGADRMRLRIQELARDRGAEFLRGLFRKSIMDAEEGARKRIRSWNDGVYQAVVFSDVYTADPALTRIFLTMYKKDDRLIFDFTGTSPENLSYSHSTAAAAVAHAATYIYAYPFWDLPISCGTFAPFEWVFPEGTVLNPTPTAAVSNSVGIDAGVMTVLPIVFSKMMFSSEERPLVNASSGACGPYPLVSGVNQWGVPIADLHSFMMNSMGQGARSDKDGMDNYGFVWCHPGRFTDVEEAENEWPVFHLSQRTLPDTGGPGKYRGGAGSELMLVPHHVPYVVFITFGSGGSVANASQGLFGGYPAPAVASSVLVKNTDLRRRMPAGGQGVPATIRDLAGQKSLKGEYEFRGPLPPTVCGQDDIYASARGGGAGYGDVLERDPRLVIEDLRKGIITPQAAREVYHVIFDPDSLTLDPEATECARQQERENRLRRGRTYDDFMAEWLQKRPKEEIIQVYGTWPDAKPVAPVIRL